MQTIGKYEVLGKIGTGGFGIVYKGRDPFIKRHVAIKTCNSDDHEMRRRFFREAEIAGSLQHPNVTTVYDFGVQGDVPFLVQEFLTGEDLDKLITRRVLSDARKVDCLIQIATGLEYAHAEGVIHRDIKPSNVRVLEGGQVKIMDFGIAKLAHLESQLTRTGITLGTASYLAPEQIRGEPVTRAADMFSYGVLAYELLAGERPFVAPSVSNLFYKILSDAPRPIGELSPSVSPALVALVGRCLEKDPARRFASFSDLLLELRPLRIDEVDGGLLVTQQLVVPREDPDAATASASAARRELAALEARVDELLGKGDATAAEIEITLARRRFAAESEDDLDMLAARIGAERDRRDGERRRAEKLSVMIFRARELAAAGSLDEALHVAQAALEVGPDHPPAMALREELTRARDAALARAVREAAVLRVEDRLAAGDLDAASAALNEFSVAHPGASEIPSLLNTLQRRRSERRAGELRAEAERLAARDNLAGAIAALTEAQRLLPADATLGQRIAALEAERKTRKLAAERAEAERVERVRREAEAAAREEAERLAAEKAEADRLERERREAEAAKAAALKAEADRVQRERRQAEAAKAAAEAAREAAERAEVERVEREKRDAEAARIAAAKAESDRRERERREAEEAKAAAEAAREAAARAEVERVERERREAEERAAAERAERERREAEARAAAERAERERREAAERAEAERLAAERAKAEAARAEAERRERERREAEAAKLAAERAEAERRERERREAEEAKRAEEDRQERRGRARVLAADARARRAAGDLAGAVARFAEAVELDPDRDAALAASLRDAREALAAVERAAARQAALAAAIAAFEGHLAAGSLRRAGRELATARASLGPDPELDALEVRLASARAAGPSDATKRTRLIAAAAGGAVLLSLGIWAAFPDRTEPTTTEPPATTVDVAPPAVVDLPSQAPEPPPAIESTPAPGASTTAPPEIVAPPTEAPPESAEPPPVAVDPRLNALASEARTALAEGDVAAALTAIERRRDVDRNDPLNAALTSSAHSAARTRANTAQRRAAAGRAPELAAREWGAAEAQRRRGERSADAIIAGRALLESATLYERAIVVATEVAAKQEQDRLAAAAAADKPPTTASPPKDIVVDVDFDDDAKDEAAPPPKVTPPAGGPAQGDPLAGVRAAIARYERAWESLDAGAVKAVWPGVDSSQLQRAFAGFERAELTVGTCVMQGAGAAVCDVEQRVQPKAGKALASAQRVRLRLVGSAWQVDGIDRR